MNNEGLTPFAPNNIIEVEVRGKPGSYITVEIRKENLNPTISNKKVDLSGSNMKTQIHLTWGYTEGVSEYIIYKAYSIDGPWMELGRVPLTNAVDITSEAQTRDLCYKIEALDSNGNVIRVYEPICVPKWQEDESSLPIVRKTIPSNKSSFAFSGSEAIKPFFKIGRAELPSYPSFQYATFSAAMPVRFQLASSTPAQKK